MIDICCGVENALAYATGRMNNHTVNYLNGFSFVTMVVVAIIDVTGHRNKEASLKYYSCNENNTR